MASDETIRDSRGRFLPGTPAPKGVGRPKRETEAEYLNTTIGAVSLEDWSAIVRMMVAQAKAGNVPAAKWLSDYLLGRPVEQLNVTSEDKSEIVLHWPTLSRDDTPALPEGDDIPALPAPDGDNGVVSFDPLAEIDRSTIESAKRRYVGDSAV